MNRFLPSVATRLRPFSAVTGASKVAVLIILFVGAVAHASATSNPPQRILFTGNSFSFYNNGIHNHVGSLVRSANKWESGQNRYRLMTLSGSHVFEQLPLLEAMLLNVDDNWQAVVLQGHSNEPVSAKKQALFASSLSDAISLLKEKKILPILFMTWEYEGDANMGKKLAAAYTDAAKTHQVPVVPVGLAFANAQNKHPSINLYVPDVLGVKTVNEVPTLTYRKELKHPSEAGTYLAACVFYAALYQQSPEGLPFTANLSAEHALALQQVAWATVKEFSR